MDKKDITEITIENLSHIIKTPLSIILGYSEILLAGIAGELNDEQLEYINKIKSEVKNTDNYLNDFIDNIEKEFNYTADNFKSINVTEVLKDIFIIFYSKCENNEKYPDFILPDKDYFYNLHEDFKKALIIIIQEILKTINSGNKLILEFKPLNENQFKIEIYLSNSAEKNFFNPNSIMIITAKKVLNLSKLNFEIKPDRVIIEYA